jgi:hypothetical protein
MKMTFLGSAAVVFAMLASTACAWGCDLLKHNQTELQRLRQDVLPILFASTS